jgi:flagellar biosynthesis protein
MKKPSKPKYPRKKAIALRYDRERENAPKVIAKGEGLLAEKLRELAKEYNIPIHENADLMEILSKLNLYEEIPPATYLVVAEILAFIYRTNEAYKA